MVNYMIPLCIVGRVNSPCRDIALQRLRGQNAACWCIARSADAVNCRFSGERACVRANSILRTPSFRETKMIGLIFMSKLRDRFLHYAHPHAGGIDELSGIAQ